MTVRTAIARICQHEDINFLLTNRIPRRLLTQFMGWFSKIEQPMVRDLSIGTWRLFSDLDLSEAKRTDFKSMHDCFVRELKDGARPIERDPSVMVSPCDAIVGACGRIDGTSLLQIKGFPYTLEDLLGSQELVERHRNGRYVTLRLTSSMYHRFHAPYDGRVERVRYISGDTWNVNPIALKRIAKLFCKNERAVIEMRLEQDGAMLTLVPVGAILVASIRLNFLPQPVRELGSKPVACAAHVNKGDEMGYFEHGSTIVVLAPAHFSLADAVQTGRTSRMGEPLLRRVTGP
jgi:phosphatidylserine decarboxylase